VVICDDDRALRTAVTALCEAAGLDVVAETDTGTSALDLVRRFHVDVLILDQSLPDMSGERVLEALLAEPDRPEVIVFSAFATDPYQLIELGARAVVDKPDFARLEEVMAALIVSLQEAEERADQDRRTTRRRVAVGPNLPPTADGVASAEDLIATAEHTVVGDSVLVVMAAAGPEGRVDPAPLLRSTVRVQDLVHRLAHLDGCVAVLRGGDATAPAGVWGRLQAAVAETGGAAHLRGAWRQVDELGLMTAIDRTEEALLARREGETGLQPA
jgi:CheY-like chemotaxis protein